VILYFTTKEDKLAEEIFMKQTHELLRELREKHQYCQAYVAKYLGTTQQSYSNYELGIREIPLHHIVKLSHLYQVSVDYLLSIEGPYMGSINLSQEYLEGVSLHQVVYDIQNLDEEKRKSLADFVRFLSSQD
jgi:transcriptional regulator with XRE-family HTH domain